MRMKVFNLFKKNKYIVLIALFLILPFVVRNKYYIHIMNMTGIFALLAIGFNILAGYTGQISLGQAAFYGIGAYSAAILNLNFHFSFWVATPLAALITCFFGLILAVPALRIKGKYLVLLTIGFGEITRLVLLNWVDLTRGPAGLIGIVQPSLFGYEIDSLNEFYYLILGTVILGAIMQARIVNSRLGRAFIAIREDERAAELTGINLTKNKIKAFVLSAMYSSVAGSLYAFMIAYISPDSFRYDESVIILCMALIGGFGTLAGPIVGAIILTIIPEALRNFGDMRMVFYGVVLIAVTMYYPGGLVKGIEKVYSKIENRFNIAANAEATGEKEVDFSAEKA